MFGGERGLLPLDKGKANNSLRGVSAVLTVAQRANTLNVATQKGHLSWCPLVWRREGDLNPRYAYDVYTISNRAHSATLTSLRAKTIIIYFNKKINRL